MKPLAPFWHEFEHSVVVGIRLLHSWQLMISHFHFHVTVESVAAAVWWKGQESALKQLMCLLCAEHCIIWVLPQWNVWTCASSCSGTLLQSNENSMEYWASCMYVILFSNLMHTFFIKSIVFLFMFLAILCSSSGGLNCICTASGSWFRHSGNKWVI